jgi:hypothetical protein
MSLLEIVRAAAGMRMQDEDGKVELLRLGPGLSATELETLQGTLPCAIPGAVRELLLFSGGFENGPLDSVAFGGLPGGFGMDEVFPHPLPIAHDGSGNFWIVDLHAHSTTWGPILYACHDPPVIVFQTASLEHFIREVLRSANPPHRSEIADVHEDAAMRIWRENPGAIPAPALRGSGDPALRTFSASLSDAHFVIDLRGAKTGDGFSWGRFGPKTNVVRYGEELLFAYESKSRWQRLLGR